VAPSTSHERGHTEATVATPQNVLLPPSIESVDRLYRQLVKIHAIAITQLAECAHWCWFDPTSSPI
jgi:hypothetical protein